MRPCLLHDYIAVRLLEVKAKTKSGLITPDTISDPGKMLNAAVFSEYPFQGKVYHAGPGWRGQDGIIRPMFCKVGDIVYFKPRPQERYEQIIIEGELLFLFRESDIIAVINMND